MDLTNIHNRLIKDNCSLQDVNLALSTVAANIRSFIYANESLEAVTVFIVFKNTGGCRVFKTIKGRIVRDKLDLSYTDSRELIALGKWNIKKSYCLTFIDKQQVLVRDIDMKEIHNVIFSLVDPTTVKYVAGVEEDNFPTTITVDCASYKGLTYKELKDCLISSYKNSLKNLGKSSVFLTEPSFYVVSFGVD